MLTHMQDRLSVVKRWGVVRTIQEQSVAEHSFRVALIAEKIARQWFNATPAQAFFVLHHALRHDELEAVSGDFPSIIKDLVDEDAVKARYADQFEDDVEVTPMVRNVVKLADKMEAMLFMVTEQALGNTTVNAVVVNLLDNTRRFIAKSFPEVSEQFEHWANQNWAEIIYCNPMDRRHGYAADKVDDTIGANWGTT